MRSPLGRRENGAFEQLVDVDRSGILHQPMNTGDLRYRPEVS